MRGNVAGAGASRPGKLGEIDMLHKTRSSFIALVVATGLSATLTQVATAQSTEMPATETPATGTQQPDQHEIHHTDDAVTPPATSPAAPIAPMTPPPVQGANPMGQFDGGNMMSMPQMQQMMQMMMQAGMNMGMNMDMGFGGTGPGMRSLRHLDGLIAFYKAELQISEAQLPQWNALAAVLQEQAKRLRDQRRNMMQMMPRMQPAPDQIKGRIEQLTAQLDCLKAIETAALPLYAVLSDRQKRIADELIAESFMARHGRRM